MPANLEVEVPHELVTPAISIPLNTPGDFLQDGVSQPLYLLRPNPYSIIPPRLRAVTDDLSQADGTSLQPPYISGLVASLYVEYWVAPNGNIEAADLACGAQLREMDFRMILALNSLRQQGPTPDGTQKLLWQPTGVTGRRMLTQVLLAGAVPWTPVYLSEGQSGGAGVGLQFELATPLPYAVDEDAVNIDITGGGGPVLVPNAGNADYMSVVTVAGATSEFAITRVDTGEVVSYVGPDEIPMGQHAEIDFFSAEIAEEGNDLIADLDPEVTTFFAVPPGGCEVEITGADCTFQSRAAIL